MNCDREKQKKDQQELFMEVYGVGLEGHELKHQDDRFFVFPLSSIKSRTLKSSKILGGGLQSLSL